VFSSVATFGQIDCAVEGMLSSRARAASADKTDVLPSRTTCSVPAPKRAGLVATLAGDEPVRHHAGLQPKNGGEQGERISRQYLKKQTCFGADRGAHHHPVWVTRVTLKWRCRKGASAPPASSPPPVRLARSDVDSASRPGDCCHADRRVRGAEARA